MKQKFMHLWNTWPGKLTCIGTVLVLLAGGCFGLSAALDPYDCRMAPGVTIGSLDVGGMSRKEARNALDAALADTLQTQPLVVHLPKDELILYPEEVSIRVRTAKAVASAYTCGRDSDSPVRDIPLAPYMTVKEDVLKTELTQYAAKWDTALHPPQWTLSGAQPQLSTADYDPEAQPQLLTLTKGTPAFHLDVDAVYGEILAAYGNVLALCEAGIFSVQPQVTPEVLPEDLDLRAITAEISTAPVNDALDMETYSFVPGAYGYGFDLSDAEAALAAAEYGETVTIPMVLTAPEILGDGVYFRDVLGSCETKHTDDENRNTNLRLLCQALDGHIIQPGEEFSYNMTVGERTAERGYKPATAYSGKRMIKDIGGGVCQGSTTLYNCALLADVEILERVCHGAKVGYIKLGLDAAVNWNTKTDLRFRNNFHFPMMIKAEVADGYVKMQLLGTDEKDYYVEMYCKSGAGEAATYASSYKKKIHKETGEILSDELEARSAYYELS